MIFFLANLMQTTRKKQNSKLHENNISKIMADLITDENGIRSGLEKGTALASFVPKFQKLTEMA